MRVATVKEIKQIEEKTFKEYGLSEDLIIENVGISGASFLIDLINKNKSNFNLSNLEFIFLIGRGNNGADGLAMARHLTSYGFRPTCFLIFPDGPYSAEAQKQLELAKKFEVKLINLKDFDQLSGYFDISSLNNIVVDAIFGTGARFPLGEAMRELFSIVNKRSHYTVAIDIPSGVHADTGDVGGEAIRSHLTLAIGLPKVGYFFSQGGKYSGRIHILTVGFPLKELENGGELYTLNEERVSDYLQGKRNIFAHKNNFGHAIIIGGSLGLTGAISMASQSALGVGAGLVTAATWASSYPELLTRLPSTVMAALIPESDSEIKRTIEEDLSRFTIAVCGPGLGRSEFSRETVINLLTFFKGPLLLDADAINMLNFKQDGELIRERSFPTIFTPHIGEFARFLGVESKEISKRPLEYVREVVESLGCFIVLKDACTLIGGPNGEFLIHHRPNDGLAKGGSGDVLAGLIGGLLAQEFASNKVEGREHVSERVMSLLASGVFIHALAGKNAAEHYGTRTMSALNLIEFFPKVFKSLLEEKNNN